MLAVLEALSSGGPDASLVHISAQVGLPRSTTHRLLQELVELGYVVTDGRGAYYSGPAFLSLAGHVLAHREFVRYVHPIAVALRDATEYTVHFAIHNGQSAIYLDKVEAKEPYKMASRVGMSIPLHCTSIGKAILSTMSNDDVLNLLSGVNLTPRTPNTMTSMSNLLADLALTRHRGFAFDNEENEKGVRCLGAAVHDSLGEVVGGVSVSALTFVLSDDEIAETGAAVQDAASAISSALGASESITCSVKFLNTGPRSKT